MELSERERDFTNKVNREISFPHEMRKEFIEYWTEPSKSGTKMRFELEKTWDLKRRLHRWLNTLPIGKSTGTKLVPQKQPESVFKSDIPEVNELDQILEIYTKHPTSIRFAEFGKYFDFMKKENLLKKFKPNEVENIKASYPNDNFKCRCACVQLTIQGYVDSGFTFAKVFELRQKIAK
jgi:intein/homing endonuclease